MNDMELLLSPRELYCLGGVLDAKYIDYAYIAALDDIGQDFKLFQKETLASLSAKGIIIEDFSGNMEMNQEYVPLLEPIFFGSIETSLDICTITDPVTVDVYKYHFHHDRITMVKAQADELLIKSITVEEIKKIVMALVPEDYECESGEKVEGFDNEMVTRFFAVKSTKIGVFSNVKTFIEADGILCTEKEDEQLESLSGEDFVTSVFDVVKGEL